jgi:hypothetical protein
VGTLTLVRHGQASYGAADYDRLSERGVAQARALAGAGSPEAGAGRLVSGPMRRQVDALAIARDGRRPPGWRCGAGVAELAGVSGIRAARPVLPRPPGSAPSCAR